MKNEQIVHYGFTNTDMNTIADALKVLATNYRQANMKDQEYYCSELYQRVCSMIIGNRKQN